MAKMSFKPENRSADTENFPKLKFDDQESGRIAIFEEPEVGYVHNLRKPKLVGGIVQYKVVKTKDGEREEMDFDFVGNPICLGDFNTLQDRRLDPKNCPACKAASEAPDMFAPPKRRFAMHVFQYTTNGTSKPTRNFQGSVKVWSFTDQKWNEILDLMEEAPGKDITKVDLILGPCENKMFQKFKIISSGQVKWQETEASQAAFQEIIEENRAPDLEKFIGRPTKAQWIEDDLDKVRAAWRVANGQANEVANDGLAGAERGNLDAGLKDLISNDPWGDALPKDTKPTATDEVKSDKKNDSPETFDDILASLDD